MLLSILELTASVESHTGSANTDAAAYEAPSDISKANGTLAEALGVKRTPTLQVPPCSAVLLAMA